ncbi:MAG: S-adenosylmethionine:tRNA ribosyltransferase-isomerase [Pseudomonadota bacterium]|nr:S-adenosylmethionine:tRNA ribosyltransferase-isomerase [Pseudomonadota bacterium]
MIAAALAVQRPRDARLLGVDAVGRVSHHARTALAHLLNAGDLVIANDAATMPASLGGIHRPSGATIEVRLASRRSLAVDDVRCFGAIVFGAGGFRSRTEDRAVPPPLASGDRLSLGPLEATVTRSLGHPRFVEIAFAGSVDALWDVWTRVAALPVAFEPPSAGFVLDWHLLDVLRARGIGFATLTHAAGLSCTGDAALDARLPFDEPYHLPATTAAAIAHARCVGGRVIALGTTVARALEHAAAQPAGLRPGPGLATNRLGRASVLRVVDALISGTHEPGSSHHELLRAFVADETLERIDAALESGGYRTHEFGDSVLVKASAGRWVPPVPGRAPSEDGTVAQATSAGAKFFRPART